MTWLSDGTLQHLRAVADEPDFAGTRYALVQEIARGGMGVIYEAEDRDLQRRVAIKVLGTDLVSPEAVERLRNEARIIAQLEHPGIVPVHDVGVLPDGRAWYAMKLVRGDVLRPEGRSRTELLRTFLRICEAVAFAHAHGVVHRDLKPENVMIGSFGEVLIMDWGVAMAMDGLREETGLIVGTRGFMAPEQERGASAAVDQRADVFALGAMLRHLMGADTPKALRAVIARAMSEDPAGRYENARELGEDVARFIDGLRVRAHRENVAERSLRWLNNNKALVGMIVAYLVMRVLVYFYGRT
ncbi:MAG TPA: serine/threonine-protein kinase [Thermoanaerobaculia bacterium]|nr:serine/threonine-protein kinase [Thermoanaerobaculia bacterium]